MTINALPSLDRTSGTFPADLDNYFLTALPDFSVQAEAARVEVNAASAAAAASASLVELAYAASNYKGPWSALTGALARPSSVTHSGNYWALAADLADVTAAVPGVSGSWTALNVGAGGATVVTSATDVTLTSTSVRMQRVVMTAADKVVTLPSATTLQLGSSLYAISNAGDESFAVRNFAGGLVVVLEPGQGVTIGLVDAATAAGVWVPIGDQDTLDALYQATATAVTVSAAASIELATLSSTQVLALWVNASAYPTAAVLTITGTSISVGAPVSVAGTPVNAGYLLRATRLSATSVALVYNAITTNYPTAVAFSISGATVTVGSPVTVNTVTTAFTHISSLSSTQAIVAYAGTSARAEARTINVSGLVVTMGAALVVAAGTFNPGLVVGISSTQAVAFYVDTAIILYAYLLTVSGTTITAGTGVPIAIANSSVADARLISPNRILIAGGGYNTLAPRLFFLDVTGGAVVLSDVKDSAGLYAGSFMSLAPLTPTKALQLFAFQGGIASSPPGTAKATVRMIRLPDGNIQIGAARTIKNSAVYTAKTAALAALSSSLAVAAYIDSTGYAQARVLEIPA